MSMAKRILLTQGIGDKNLFKIGPKNTFIGSRVKVTWLRPWGKKHVGYQVEGVLLQTLCVNGRTLIGEVLGRDDTLPLTSRDRKYSCPWSRNYISVEVLEK